jgi:hypothetical protein
MSSPKPTLTDEQRHELFQEILGEALAIFAAAQPGSTSPRGLMLACALSAIQNEISLAQFVQGASNMYELATDMNAVLPIPKGDGWAP